MSAMPTNTEPATRVYARFLRELHRLLAAGEGDSDEADNVRDEMDAPWYAMTEAERQRVEGLSEDLYRLADGGVKPVPLATAERKQWGQDFKRAWDSGDWDRILTMLRRPPADVPMDAVAFMQARCWERLDDPATALLFMREAERLNSEDAVFVMLLLEQLGDNEEATAAAQRIIDDLASGYEALYLAAGVLIGQAQWMSPERANPILARAVEALRRGLSHVRPLPPRQRQFPEVESLIVCMLGLCLERLGQTPEAIAVYDEFLTRYPANSDVLTFRGIARYNTDLEGALRDFWEAVQVGASSVWPYYFLAHHALERGDYGRCLAMCQGGIGKTTRAEVLAQLHEWTGISHAMLGHPARSALESFELAQRLDPEQQRIVYNRTVFHKMTSETDQPAPLWRLPAPLDAKQGLAELLQQQRLLQQSRFSDEASELPLVA